MISYELREAYAGTVEQILTVDDKGDPVDTATVPAYTGGVMRVGDRDLNIRELLDAGDGRIDIDEETPEGAAAVIALDDYPPLKRAAAEAAPARKRAGKATDTDTAEEE